MTLQHKLRQALNNYLRFKLHDDLKATMHLGAAAAFASLLYKGKIQETKTNHLIILPNKVVAWCWQQAEKHFDKDV